MSRRNDSMCDGDLDAILSYLSSRINKIFCDREFVGCVKEDFDIILQSTNSHYCVVFPKLKPIFLKVLRYQAVIFDLSVFCIGSGCNQVAVVCKKTFLKEQANECPREESKETQRIMDSEEKASKTTRRTHRVNRPTQSYYVPPAQRSSAKQKPTQDNVKAPKKIQTKSKLQSENSRKYEIEQELDGLYISKTNHESKVNEESSSETLGNLQSIICIDENDIAKSLSSEVEVEPCTENNQPIVNKNIDESEDYLGENLKDEVEELKTNGEDTASKTCDNNISADLILDNDDSKIDDSRPCTNDRYLVDSCETIEDVQYVNDSANSLQLEVQINEKENICREEELVHNVQKDNIFLKLANDYFSLNDTNKTNLKELNLHKIAEDILENMKTELHIPTEEAKVQVSVVQISPNETIDKISMCLESILTENNRAYETNESADKEVAKELLVQRLVEETNSLFSLKATNNDHSNDVELIPSTDAIINNGSSESVPIQSDKEEYGNGNPSSTPPLYIAYDNDSISKKDVYIVNENEEIQRTTENNKKSRSVLKHNIKNVDSLKLVQNEAIPQKQPAKNLEDNFGKEEQDGASTWEDMFDESGDLHSEYVEEIVKRIGCSVKVVKASHDYSAYQNTKYQDLEHVIELYDFPSTFKTQDLIQLYRGASQDPMYIKWCDDTHALLVLSSPTQAQRALQIEHDIIKARPLSQASTVAAVTASSADLKPAMKRPQTNMQTARRLINTHLGTKSKLSKEVVEQERRALLDAREQRRQERQNEKDAWEGRPRSAKSVDFS